MELNYSITTKTHLIEVFSESKGQPGTVVVTETDKNDAILIEGFKTIRTFAKAIEQVEQIVPPDQMQIVIVTKGTEQWLSVFTPTFNWHNGLRTGYIKDRQEDPLSILNQNIFPNKPDGFDWLDD